MITPDVETQGRDEVLAEFFAEQRRLQRDRHAAVAVATTALERLCQLMQGRSGQCYKVRALLYSLWNGKPTSVIEVLGLDWQIRKDVCAVILAFGWEVPGGSFFYKEIKNAITQAGQWEWFIEEGEKEEA